MRRGAQAVRIGDFVKASDNNALVSLLDRWLAEVMTRLMANPRWKLHYDALAPLQFAFVGTRSRWAIAGQLIASSDRSRRRFPFLGMGAFEVAQPAAFVPRSPLVLGGLWQRLDALMADVQRADEPAQPLRALASCVHEVAPDGPGHATEMDDFLQRHTLDSLAALLAPAGHGAPLRQLALALGLLLREAPAQTGLRFEKSLALPLPRAAATRHLVAAFWLHLVAPLVRRQGIELALFVTELRARPVLVIGFCGADPDTLRALIDPQAASERLIVFDQLDWVDGQLEQDAALRRLSSCLQQEQLSLRSACAMFMDVFASPLA